jgi:hypothetical protein
VEHWDTDGGCDGRSKYSIPVTILLHKALVAFLDIHITRKLNNDTLDTCLI